MAAEGTHVDPRRAQAGPAGAGELIDRLSRFDGPPEQFLVNLLAVQCRLASARGGAILRPGEQGQAEVLAVHPPPEPGKAPPAWLSQAVASAREVGASGTTTVKALHGEDDLYGQPAQCHLVFVPLRRGGTVRGAAAYVIESNDPAALAAGCERLELTVSLLSLYEMRLSLQQRQVDLRRLQTAMGVLAVVNEQDRFAGAGMSMCNEVNSRWECDRVSLGFLKGRYVHLKALSHTEKFSRKMKLVQDIEATMEECLDQDVEITYPPDPQATFVSRGAGELSMRHGPTTVLSVPMRKAGEPRAVLTVERPPNRPFSLPEVESLRLACDLCTPRLENLHEYDRWLGARVAAILRKGLAHLVGPKHTWIKVAAILVTAVVVFLVFAKGEYRADAPFSLDAIDRHVVPAPFDGFLKSVSVEPPDRVVAGETVLAELYTDELRMELTGAESERNVNLTRAAVAREDRETAQQAGIAEAEAEKYASQVRLLEHRIKKAKLVSPVTGMVITGDLKRQIGAPVKIGDVLFEVAPPEALRAELRVPEDQIAEIRVGQEGELATAGYPGRRIGFVVERITPVAQVVDQRNVFNVRVKLKETRRWMRPGMEGVAKVDLGRRRYVWLWTRRLVNWFRMKFWL